MEIGDTFLASERDALKCIGNRDFALFIFNFFIYMARKTSFSARASNYVLVKRSQKSLPNTLM